MSTLAAASLNRDVIYVGRSDLRIDASGIVVPADVTVDVSPKATTGPAGSVPRLLSLAPGQRTTRVVRHGPIVRADRRLAR